MNKFRKITLPNGFRILLAPQPQSLAASVLVLVAAGSEYETKRTNGVSHFLEHMVFKQTIKRPRVGQISEELDALGGHSNAFTLQEQTGYWVKAAAKKLPKILDIVSDIYMNPIFAPGEIERERGVIIEEINMDEDRLRSKAAEVFVELLYGNQPAGWKIAGEKEVLKKIFKKEIEAYRNARYVSAGTVLVVAGKFNEKQVLKQVRATFGRLPKRRAPKKPKTVERQARPRALAHFRKANQSHLVVGFRAFDMFDKRRYALQVLADILGGGMSSRLFKRVREELGAAYYIYADTDLSLDHGSFEVAAGVDHAKFRIVLRAILEEFRRLRDEDVPEKELQRAKDHMTGGLVLGLEAADELGSFYATQELLTGKVLPPEKVIANIKRVTAADVRQVAQDIFKESRLNLAVVGPYKNPKALEKFLKL